MKRLLIATKGGREMPSSRYRAIDLLPHLELLGWQVARLSPSISRGHRLRNLVRDTALAAQRWDAVLLQRVGWRREDELLVRLAAHRAGVVAVDLDDIMDPSREFLLQLRVADVLFAASRGVLARWGGAVARAELVPTALDTGLYARREPSSGGPVLGWIGNAAAYAVSLERMVRACAAASPGPWRLRIVGTGGDAALEATLRAAAGELDVELVAGIDWESEAAVAGEVAGFDAGLSPLRDFDGGSFKTVQYLAAGAIPIAEAGGEAEHHVRLAMGEDAAVVEPGDAEAIAVWLRRLADPALRDRLAQRARAGAAQHFSQVVIAAQIDGVLREALASAQPR